MFRGAPVILISVDTLRADHLPAYGYRGVETPHLDALRKDSVLFENAYAHVPADAAVARGDVHGASAAAERRARQPRVRARPSGPPTLAAYLKEKGYATGGAVSSIVLSHVTGVGRGFEFYEDTVEPDRRSSQTLSRVQRHGDETAALLTRLDRRRAPTSRSSRSSTSSSRTRPTSRPSPSEPVRAGLRRGDRARPTRSWASFLRYLKDQEIYDRALIIFLSDHGEGLNDHGEDEHGVLLYREAIHVPLIVKFPKSRRAGESVAEAGRR